jgi:hypothetical protein
MPTEVFMVALLQVSRKSDSSSCSPWFMCLWLGSTLGTRACFWWHKPHFWMPHRLEDTS